MIERYSDHAANERTFLAWVRTAIAIMAFGFLVEKFDLFLRIEATASTARTVSIPGQLVGDVAGLLLIAMGGAMMAFAAIRFRLTARDIDAQDVRRGPGERMDFTPRHPTVNANVVGTAVSTATGTSRRRVRSGCSPRGLSSEPL
jgi:putative membrane protein